MVVMARERWTDERIDERFDRIDTDIRELRMEMRTGFEQIDKRFQRVDERFEVIQREMTARFDAVQRNMTTWFVALFSTILAGLLTGLFALISLT